MSRGSDRPGPGRRRPALALPPARLLPAMLACFVASGAAAAAETIVARRTSEHVHLDGRLDDAAWTAALVYSRRHVTRTHQVFDSVLIPPDANHVKSRALVVSRFGRLEGLVDIRPRRGFELLAYAAVRASARPRFSDPRRPHPRLVDPALASGSV